MSENFNIVSLFRPWPELKEVASRRREEFWAAAPFPHTVIDGFLPEGVAGEAEGALGGLDPFLWYKLKSPNIDKQCMGDEPTTPSVLRNLLYLFNGRIFLDFLTELTGIKGIVADPRGWYAGIQRVSQGHRLDVHNDLLYHSEMGLFRALSVTLYVSRNWRPEYGGELELWSPKPKACRKKIEPIFNRCVILGLSGISYHGHPEPFACPPDYGRICFQLFYYQNLSLPERALLHTSSFWLEQKRLRVGQWTRSARQRLFKVGFKAEKMGKPRSDQR